MPNLRTVWPECPEELARVVMKMMLKQPAARQQTYAEVIADLRRAYEALTSSTMPNPKSKALLWSGIAAAVAILGTLIYVTFANRPPQLSEAEHAAKAKHSALPAAATKDASFVNSLGMKFVPVAGTKVLCCIHETRYKDYAAFAKVAVGINADWKGQICDGFTVRDGAEHPVTKVNWEDAQAFCVWLSKKEGKTYRLPADREWSYAVGIGDLEKDGTTPQMLSDKIQTEFPWGGDFPTKTTDKAGNYADLASHREFPTLPFIDGYDDGFPVTAPVMSFKPNKLNLYDLGGNVLEWVEDW
ncbi:MAG: SUMF1/EgtB/PvdO family nonheme iron enzyme [Chthoniobacteraceae bacterium]